MNERIEREDGQASERPRPDPSPAEPRLPAPEPALEPVAAQVKAATIATVAEVQPEPHKALPVPQTNLTPPRTAQRARFGFSVAELAAVAARTGDPILIAEVARRTTPPPPPEPAPTTLDTPELIARLPGRHDLVMATARRLAEDMQDFKPASQRTFELMARSVAEKSAPAHSLLDCWRQATGPKARHQGKVLVAAWKHTVGQRC